MLLILIDLLSLLDTLYSSKNYIFYRLNNIVLDVKNKYRRIYEANIFNLYHNKKIIKWLIILWNK